MPKAYQVQDKYFHLAKEKGYRARSAFKLLDIQEKFRLIRPGQTLVDLGAAPGSFLQVILELVGSEGQLLGLDLQEIDPFEAKNVQTEVVDILETGKVLELLTRHGLHKVDGVTSDLAPKTSGIRDLDQGRSAELTDQAFHLATQILKPGGYFVGKVFEGPDLAYLIKRMKQKFQRVTLFKPASSRDRSLETFIVATGFVKLRS